MWAQGFPKETTSWIVYAGHSLIPCPSQQQNNVGSLCRFAFWVLSEHPESRSLGQHAVPSFRPQKIVPPFAYVRGVPVKAKPKRRCHWRSPLGCVGRSRFAGLHHARGQAVEPVESFLPEGEGSRRGRLVGLLWLAERSSALGSIWSFGSHVAFATQPPPPPPPAQVKRLDPRINTRGA